VQVTLLTAVCGAANSANDFTDSSFSAANSGYDFTDSSL
jgi:hypothetical protein